MNSAQLKEMRRNITTLIDDIKYHSDGLTDLDRLPVIQLKVILAKINKLNEKTTILLHYVEKEGKLSDKVYEDQVKGNTESETLHDKEVKIEDSILPTEKEGNGQSSSSQDIEGKLKKLLVTDLTEAFGINEKYLYAGTLFKGNIEKFTKAVHEINELPDKDSAKSYLNSLEKEYSWDPENETVINFIDLVERKFDQF